MGTVSLHKNSMAQALAAASAFDRMLRRQATQMQMPVVELNDCPRLQQIGYQLIKIDTLTPLVYT